MAWLGNLPVFIIVLIGASSDTFAADRFTFLSANFYTPYIYDNNTGRVVYLTPEHRVFDYTVAGDKFFFCTVDISHHAGPVFNNFYYGYIDSVTGDNAAGFHHIDMGDRQHVHNMTPSPDRRRLLLQIDELLNDSAERWQWEWSTRFEILDVQTNQRHLVDAMHDGEILMWHSEDDLLVRRDNALSVFSLATRQYSPFAHSLPMPEPYQPLEVYKIDDQSLLFIVQDATRNSKLFVHSNGISNEIYRSTDFQQHTILGDGTIGILEKKGQHADLVFELVILDLDGIILDRINLSELLDAPYIWPYVRVSENTSNGRLMIYSYGGFYRLDLKKPDAVTFVAEDYSGRNITRFRFE